MPQSQQMFKSNMSVYGADKVWRAHHGARRQGSLPAGPRQPGVQSGSTQPVVGQRLHLRQLPLPQSLAGLHLRGLPG